jgi:hypothetical protein
MRKGLQSRLLKPLRPILESLEPRVLLSAAPVLATGHGYQFETLMNTVDPVTSVYTHVAISISRDTTTDATGACSTSYFSFVYIQVTDAEGQSLMDVIHAVYTAAPPPYTLTVTPAGDAAEFVATFQLLNSDTFKTDTLAIHLQWKLGQANLKNTDNTLTLIPGTPQLFSATVQGGDATASGTLNWTELEPTLLDRIPTSLSVTPSNSSGDFSISSRQTIALTSNARLSALVQSLTPPARTPNNAAIYFNSGRGAFAESQDWSAVIHAGTGFQFVASPTLPLSTTPSAFLSFFNPNYYVFAGANSAISISPDAHSATISAVIPTVLNLPDGSAQSATLNVDLLWQWTGIAPTITLERLTSYESGYTRNIYLQSVAYDATLSGTISSDNPLFTMPTFSSVSIQLSSQVDITTPAGATPSNGATLVSQQTWQQTILQPWRYTTQLINKERPDSERPGKPSRPQFHINPFPFSRHFANHRSFPCQSSPAHPPSQTRPSRITSPALASDSSDAQYLDFASM